MVCARANPMSSRLERSEKPGPRAAREIWVPGLASGLARDERLACATVQEFER